MSYPKNYKLSELYQRRPDVVEMLLDMKPGDSKSVSNFPTKVGASSMRYAVYGFQLAFFNHRRFSISIDRNKYDSYDVTIKYPKVEGELEDSDVH